MSGWIGISIGPDDDPEKVLDALEAALAAAGVKQERWLWYWSLRGGAVDVALHPVRWRWRWRKGRLYWTISLAVVTFQIPRAAMRSGDHVWGRLP